MRRSDRSNLESIEREVTFGTTFPKWSATNLTCRCVFLLRTVTKYNPSGKSKVGTLPSAKGPEDWFTGSVRIDPLFQPNDYRRAAAATVTFEPGARTAWHTHPLGQTLIIVSGIGWVQKEGSSIEEVRPGDIVWFAPNERHWHGASPVVAMSHIAIQEQLNGKVVDWMEKVSDEQYKK